MRFLIIEDDETFALLVAKALDGLALPAITATNWEDAERFLEEAVADVVWVDLRMPGVSTELQTIDRIRWLRTRFEDIVIIVGSGYISPEIRDQLKLLGVDEFLYKGSKFEPKQIASLIVRGIMAASGRGAKVDEKLLPMALEWMHERFPNTLQVP